MTFRAILDLMLHLTGRRPRRPPAEHLLRPRPLGPGWRAHAERLAAEWRAAGGEVDLVEYAPMPREPGRYVLTARDAAASMTCVCESWARRRDGAPVWSVTVTLRPLTPGAASPGRRAGVALAAGHDRAWAAVRGWLEGTSSLHPSLEVAAWAGEETAAAVSRVRPDRGPAA